MYAKCIFILCALYRYVAHRDPFLVSILFVMQLRRRQIRKSRERTFDFVGGCFDSADYGTGRRKFDMIINESRDDDESDIVNLKMADNNNDLVSSTITDNRCCGRCVATVSVVLSAHLDMLWLM